MCHVPGLPGRWRLTAASSFCLCVSVSPSDSRMAVDVLPAALRGSERVHPEDQGSGPRGPRAKQTRSARTPPATCATSGGGPGPGRDPA